MKYEIIDRVSRFVKRFGMIMDPETMNKAKAEAEDYDFRLISKDHYTVRHADKMYVIIEREGQIGCSCNDMTYNRMDGSVCKHIIAFSRLMEKITELIDDADRGFLVNVGWTGKELHPPELQIPPDPDLDLGVDDPLPEPEPLEPEKPVKVSAKCQYCGMGATRKNQEVADAWKEVHEAQCPKNPANKATSDPDGESNEGEDPIPPGAKPPKTRPEQTTALSTGREFPDEREFTNAKVAAHVKNRGGFYKNQKGDEIPDSAAMSLYALDTCRISTETVLIEKNGDQAKAVVRGYKGGVSVDASVILRFDVLKRRELLKMAKKYPKAIIDWTEEMIPILNLNFTLKDKTPIVTLGEHMFNFAIDQEQFSERTAETLARRRVFDMLSGVDWRDDVEVQVEDADAASMGSKKR